MMVQLVPIWLQPLATWFGSARGLLQLRLLLLLVAGWWFLAPLSALLAQGLSFVLSRTDAVIVASFCGPLLCLGLILSGLWLRRLRLVLVAMLLLLGIIELSVGGLL